MTSRRRLVARREGALARRQRDLLQYGSAIEKLTFQKKKNGLADSDEAALASYERRRSIAADDIAALKRKLGPRPVD